MSKEELIAKLQILHETKSILKDKYSNIEVWIQGRAMQLIIQYVDSPQFTKLFPELLKDNERPNE